MKKKLVILAIICLSLFVFRDFIIRQYFISKIKYVDYDEYILIGYLNGKMSKATYVGADFMIVLGYNADEEVEHIVAYDYDKRIQYQYNLTRDKLEKKGNNEDRQSNINNNYLLELLKSKEKFKFKGSSEINNKECYFFEFETEEYIRSIYLDKGFLYVLKIKEQFKDTRKDLIYIYELDLEVKNKDLFKEYIN